MATVFGEFANIVSVSDDGADFFQSICAGVEVRGVHAYIIPYYLRNFNPKYQKRFPMQYKLLKESILQSLAEDDNLTEAKFGMSLVPSVDSEGKHTWDGIYTHSGGVTTYDSPEAIATKAAENLKYSKHADIAHFSKQDGFDTEVKVGDKMRLRPTVLRLKKTGLDCYGLFQMTDLYFQKALKRFLWRESEENREFEDEAEVNFVGESREAFMDDAAKELVRVLRSVWLHMNKQLGKKRVELKYIVYPQSGASFNREFSNMMSKHFASYGMDTQVVPDYFTKSKTGITIDEHLAQLMGMDGDEITELQYFIAETEAKHDLFETRKEIEDQINKVLAPEEERLGGKNFYQYTSKTERQMEDEKKRSYFSKNDEFFDRKSVESKIGMKNGGRGKESVEVKYTGRGQNVEDEINLNSSFVRTTEILKKAMNTVKKKYGSFEKLLQKIEQGRDSNIKKFNGGKIWSTKPQHRNHTVKTLDRMLDKEGKLDTVKDKEGNYTGKEHNWEIKKFADPARKALTKLFSLDKEAIDIERERNNSAIVIFDDDVAGGGTFEDVCKTAVEYGWRHIIPCTLMYMRISDGTNIKDGSVGFARKKGMNDKGLLTSIEDADRRKMVRFFDDDANDEQTVSNTYNPKYDPSETPKFQTGDELGYSIYKRLGRPPKEEFDDTPDSRIDYQMPVRPEPPTPLKSPKLPRNKKILDIPDKILKTAPVAQSKDLWSIPEDIIRTVKNSDWVWPRMKKRPIPHVKNGTSESPLADWSYPDERKVYKSIASIPSRERTPEQKRARTALLVAWSQRKQKDLARQMTESFDEFSRLLKEFSEHPSM